MKDARNVSNNLFAHPLVAFSSTTTTQMMFRLGGLYYNYLAGLKPSMFSEPELILFDGGLP